MVLEFPSTTGKLEKNVKSEEREINEGPLQAPRLSARGTFRYAGQGGRTQAEQGGLAELRRWRSEFEEAKASGVICRWSTREEDAGRVKSLINLLRVPVSLWLTAKL